MSVYIDALKQLNLVDFLTQYYGFRFSQRGTGYVASSPFGVDQNPSFFVRLAEGRWLFKDFSSGLGGSIIDLVGRLEGLSGVGQIVSRIEALVGRKAAGGATEPKLTAATPATLDQNGRDIGYLHRLFARQAPDVCRHYLLGRGIKRELVDDLIDNGEVVHNRYQGRSYCCFAVYDAAGQLQCLDNHEIEGSGKFVLGRKSAYSRDWGRLPSSIEAFIVEGIIDYLSIKTLEGDDPVGLALLGNQLIFDSSILAGCHRLLGAFDDDRGGTAAFVDLVEMYPDKELKQYRLEA